MGVESKMEQRPKNSVEIPFPSKPLSSVRTAVVFGLIGLAFLVSGD
jgi:hypothetical protein